MPSLTPSQQKRKEAKAARIAKGARRRLKTKPIRLRLKAKLAREMAELALLVQTLGREPTKAELEANLKLELILNL